VTALSHIQPAHQVYHGWFMNTFFQVKYCSDVQLMKLGVSERQLQPGETIQI
jgi:hypothetical protein